MLLLVPSLYPSPHVHRILENQQPCNHSSHANQVALEPLSGIEERIITSLSVKKFPWKAPFLAFTFIWPQTSLCMTSAIPCLQPMPSNGIVENNPWQLFNIAVAWGSNTSGSYQQTDKKLKREKLGNEMSFEKLRHSRKFRSPHTWAGLCTYLGKTWQSRKISPLQECCNIWKLININTFTEWRGKLCDHLNWHRKST